MTGKEVGLEIESEDDDYEDSSDDDYEDSTDEDIAAVDIVSVETLATPILSREKFEEEIALMQKRVELELYRNQNIELDKVIASKEEELARTKEEHAKIKEEHARIKEELAKIKELLLKRGNARVAGGNLQELKLWKSRNECCGL